MAEKIVLKDPFPGIEARPLNLPNFVDLKKKNQGIALRWVNRVAGEGMRLDECVSMGFTFATSQDVEVPPSLMRDGKIVKGDLVLMKIDKAAYDGALKHNWMRAVSRLHPSAVVSEGQAQLKNTLNEVEGKAEDKGKMRVFTPGDKEKSMLPPDISSNPLQKGGS